MRVETASIHREQLLALQKHADVKVASHIQYVEENRQMIMKIRESIQELARGVSSALAKKADHTEVESTREELMSKIKEDALDKTAELSTTMNMLTDVEQQRKERSHITSEKYKGILVATEKMRIQLTETSSKHEEEIFALKKSFLDYKLRHKEHQDVGAKGGIVNVDNNANDNNDWRIAVGKLSTLVKNGMEDRPDREELLSTIQRHAKIEKEKSLDPEATIQRLDKLDAAVREVKTGHKMKLRLFWTSGGVDNLGGRVVNWDVLGYNTSPTYLRWKRSKSSVVHIRSSGLYRVILAVFTRDDVTIDLQLNGSSILVKKSGESSSSLARPKHAAGDVTCLFMNEYVSLPAESNLSARIMINSSNNGGSGSNVQALLDVRKS
jgi:hypothetical protein